MPNWVSTTMYIDGKDSDKLLSIFRDCADNNKTVFDEFVPRPKTYSDYDTTNYSTYKDNGWRNLLEVGRPLPEQGSVRTRSGKVTKQYWRDFRKAEKEQKEKYGVVGWYDWNCKYWGTKWDASDLYVSPHDNHVDFMTAWSFPEPILEMIAKNYDVVIDGMFEEEGNFHGNFQVHNGQFNIEYLDGSGIEEDEED